MSRGLNGVSHQAGNRGRVGAVADQATTRRIHAAVLTRLADELEGHTLAPADQRQLVLAWVQAELDAEAGRRAVSGEPQLDHTTERAVARAVENAMWGLGRMQELLDVPGVEDIHITGCELPVLRMADGSTRTASAPIADTDGDLVQQLQR